MTQSSAPTMPTPSGDSGASGDTRTAPLARRPSPQAARRRWLILFAVLVLIVVAVVANIGPMTHYQDAKARLDKAMAEVDTLQTEKAQLQGRLAKLSETGYLEALARAELAYVRPGEELYIVTKTPGDGADDSAVGSDRGSAGSTGVTGLGTSVAGDPGSTNVAADEANTSTTDEAARPGLLERAISAIRGLF